ncbi:MAG: GAF domain-containing protein [Colwellia sp.]|nr:GAF domain-containing protein [Colwellia sp.]
MKINFSAIFNNNNINININVLFLLVILIFSPRGMASPTPASSSPLLQFPFSQPYFKTLSGQGKISNGVVTNGLQGNNGLLWLTTQNGLVEYDGYQYQKHTYNPDDINSLPGNNIYGIAQQNNGVLWLTTRSNGLASFDPVTREVQRFAPTDKSSSITSNRPRSVFISKDQTIWVSHEQGIDHLTSSGKLIRLYKFPSKTHGVAYSFMEPSEGVIWAGGSFGLLQIKNNKVTIIPELAKLDIRDLFKDSNGMYWLGTRNGLWLWQGHGKVRAPKGISVQGNHAYFMSIVQDDKGIVWGATYGSGLWMFDGKTQSLMRKFVHDPSVLSSLASNDIGKLILDENQNLWVGTWGGGLQLLQLGSINNFATIRYSLLDENTLSYGNIRSILVLKNNYWLFGRIGNGLDIFSPTSGRLTTIEFTQANDKVVDIISLMEDKQGIVWAGSHTQGLYRIDVATRQAIDFKVPELTKTSIKTLLLMKSGERIIGTTKGVCVLHPNLNRCQFIRSKTGAALANSVYSLIEDKHGNLWAATNAGLFRRKTNSTYLEEFSSHTSTIKDDLVRGVINHNEGLYVVTSKGFFLVTNINEIQPVFTELSSQFDFGKRRPGANMLLDNQDRLWSASTFVDFDKRLFNRISKSEGVDIGTIWLGAYTQLPSGTMLFGGTKGVLIIEPDNFEPTLPSSKIVIRKYKLNGENQTLPTNNQLALGKLSRSFSIQIAALDLNDSSTITYQYRLHGQNSRWLKLDANSRWIKYTNLSPGNYTLQIKGKYAFNQGEVIPLNISVTVTPALWQTLWFKLAFVAVVILVLTLTFRWRIHFLKEKARQLEVLVSQKSQEIEAINSIGREFTTQLTLDDVFQEIYRHIQQIVTVDTFGIGLVNKQQNIIEFEYAIEQNIRFNRYTRALDQPEQLAVFCVLNKRCILINDYNQEYSKYHKNRDDRPQKLSDGSMAKRALSMVYVPMTIRQQVIGVIGMQGFVANSYSKSDVIILETLASYAAIAVENARSQEKLIMQEKMAFLGQLVAGVAHEMNTPLGIAITGISVLDDKLCELKQTVEKNELKRNSLEKFIKTSTESLTLIKPNLSKTAELIQQFKRVAANEENTNITQIDIHHLLDQVISSVQAEAKSYGISICLENSQSILLDTVPSILSQVILIIINNAIQHGFTQHRQGKITLRYYQGNEGLTIECQDNGVGIDTLIHDKIFSPFYTTSRESGAAGLGLSIAFNMINMQLSGTLKLTSQIGKGATFIIKLPKQ